jgi:hypothetical protein
MTRIRKVLQIGYISPDTRLLWNLLNGSVPISPECLEIVDTEQKVLGYVISTAERKLLSTLLDPKERLYQSLKSDPATSPLLLEYVQHIGKLLGYDYSAEE